MRTLPRLWAHSFFLGIAVFSLTGILLSSASLLAQAPKPPSTSNTASGFSIETEMLTYRALESNGEAIACDIAAYLHNATANFKSPPPGMVCNVTGSGSNAHDGVIVFPFDRTVFADFLIWRSDMQTMAEFEKRGADACTAPPPPAAAAEPNKPAGVSGRGLTASTAATAATSVGGVMGALTPAGAMLSTGSGLLSLFASDQASSPVGGTIEDQAFMDDVSRELRAENVPVLMPSVYSPFALTSIDPVRSPFLISLDKLLHTRDCLAAGKTSSSDLDVKNIDGFLAALTAPPSAPAAKPATGATPSTPAPATGASTTAAAAPSAPPGPSHLQSALIADGLAQRLGADPQTGLIPGDAPQHVLLLKALESGGSVTHSSNIFGGKMSYSGGSVGTYALFDLNGQLECSGNVYDYAGYITAKNFQKELRAYKPDPSNQVIFNRGGCRAR